MAASGGTVALEQALLRRILGSGDARRWHVRFTADVLDRYRAMPQAELIRTRTVGRVSLPRRWSLDLGIAEAEDGTTVLHATVDDLLTRLPVEERDHWIAHLLPEPASANFLQMKMAAGACIDDGETQPWV